MSRPIKFRGKVLEGMLSVDKYVNSWIYGDLSHLGDDFCISSIDSEEQIENPELIIPTMQVDPATVGQFTGLSDKNGKEIYEGDRLKCKCKKRPLAMPPRGKQKYVYKEALVEWWSSSCAHGYRLKFKHGTMMAKQGGLNTMEVEVIGNIHEDK